MKKSPRVVVRGQPGGVSEDTREHEESPRAVASPPVSVSVKVRRRAHPAEPPPPNVPLTRRGGRGAMNSGTTSCPRGRVEWMVRRRRSPLGHSLLVPRLFAVGLALLKKHQHPTALLSARLLVGRVLQRLPLPPDRLLELPILGMGRGERAEEEGV